MGTNYYKIPTEEEMSKRHAKLIDDVSNIGLTPSNIESGFQESIEDSWGTESVWDKFTSETNIHLGKRSMGWKFLWNFNENKYYTNKEELLEFIRGGRVVDEYGEEVDIEEFIEMALKWGSERENGGWDLESYYIDNPGHRSPYSKPETYVDGLRISDSIDFS